MTPPPVLSHCVSGDGNIVLRSVTFRRRRLCTGSPDETIIITIIIIIIIVCHEEPFRNTITEESLRNVT
ncbi:hypothetical protein EYF80_053654 [Liparis tanakae]|uniref:Uncharacterized protein n=1 Tax=Liparis tanakae TaxID=230148 RepID=A0A4Z2F5Z5_9TELE|nr:hypothetical protein EYF80_053654 [Liparis tanakae]